MADTFAKSLPKLSPHGKKTAAMSSRAKRGICFFSVLLAVPACVVKCEPKRPRILGIDHVQLFTSDISAETEFYRKIGLLKECPPDETKTQSTYRLSECGFGPKHTFSV